MVYKKLVQSILTLTLTLFTLSVNAEAECSLNSELREQEDSTFSVNAEAECSLNSELREEEGNTPETDNYPELTDELLNEMVDVLITGLLMDDPGLLNDSSEVREQIVTKLLSDRFEKLNYHIIPPLDASVKAQLQEIIKKETVLNFSELQRIEEDLKALIGSCYALVGILKYFSQDEAIEEVRQNIGLYKDILDEISKKEKDLKGATSNWKLLFRKMYAAWAWILS